MVEEFFTFFRSFGIRDSPHGVHWHACPTSVEIEAARTAFAGTLASLPPAFLMHFRTSASVVMGRIILYTKEPVFKAQVQVSSTKSPFGVSGLLSDAHAREDVPCIFDRIIILAGIVSNHRAS